MKKILLIATGGTIASGYTEEGLAPKIAAAELLQYVEGERTIQPACTFLEMSRL